MLARLVSWSIANRFLVSLGVVGIGIGAGFGARALALRGQLDEECVEGLCSVDSRDLLAADEDDAASEADAEPLPLKETT